MRGPKPQLKSAGNLPAHGGLGKPPTDLDAEHRELWDFLVAENKHLRPSDAPILVMLIDTLLAYQQSVAGAAKTGIWVKGEMGGLVMSPCWRTSLRFSAHALRLAEALGMTPPTRGRVVRR